MSQAYERKPRKEKKEKKAVTHYCDTCQYFLWGIITPFREEDGLCMKEKEKAKRRYHHAEACSNWLANGTTHPGNEEA